jgi:hypothetical protein
MAAFDSLSVATGCHVLGEKIVVDNPDLRQIGPFQDTSWGLPFFESYTTRRLSRVDDASFYSDGMAWTLVICVLHEVPWVRLVPKFVNPPRCSTCREKNQLNRLQVVNNYTNQGS